MWRDKPLLLRAEFLNQKKRCENQFSQKHIYQNVKLFLFFKKWGFADGDLLVKDHDTWMHVKLRVLCSTAPWSLPPKRSVTFKKPFSHRNKSGPWRILGWFCFADALREIDDTRVKKTKKPYFQRPATVFCRKHVCTGITAEDSHDCKMLKIHGINNLGQQNIKQ